MYKESHFSIYLKWRTKCYINRNGWLLVFTKGQSFTLWLVFLTHLLYDGHLSKSTIYMIVFNSCRIIDNENVPYFIQLFLSLLGETSVWFQFFDSTNKAEVNILYIYLCALMLLFPKDWFPKVSVLSKRICVFLLLPDIIITISLKAFSSLPTHTHQQYVWLALSVSIFTSRGFVPSVVVASFCISLTNNEVKNFSIYLLDIFIFSSGNCLFIMHFAIHSFALLWSRYI